MKNFQIPRWEGARLGLGVQVFNLFNHPNFDKPVNDLAQGAGNFGVIQSTVSEPTSILGSFQNADASGPDHPSEGEFDLLALAPE